jgi:glycosylphosphatidylinositol transamidase (GPIT) subunit GPI8
MTRYVAIFESHGQNSTFVLDGSMTVEDLFASINERQVLHSGVKAISLHVDRSEERPFLEEMFGRNLSEEESPPT